MSLLIAPLERVRAHRPTVSLSSSLGPGRPGLGSRLDLEVRHDYHDAFNCCRHLRAQCLAMPSGSLSPDSLPVTAGSPARLTRSTFASSQLGARSTTSTSSRQGARTSSASAVTSRSVAALARGCPEALHSRRLLPLRRRGGASRALTCGPCPPAQARLRVARHRPRSQRTRRSTCGSRARSGRRARPHLVAGAERTAGLRGDRCQHRMGVGSNADIEPSPSCVKAAKSRK